MLLGTITFAASPDLSRFKTNAKFSVDNNNLNLTTAIATIEPRLGALGYSWLRIYFYSFSISSEDLVKVESGDLTGMEMKWNNMATNPSQYNTTHAVLQLAVDKNYKVWQVDLSLPGKSCTIAPFEKEIKSDLQEYKFDGRNLRLKSAGTYICDMRFMKVPDQKYTWKLDLNIPVYQKK